ncbi:MAG TPA: hypothetical protein PKA82_00755 [Pyrinomonadaceae bacterium]|nr:hypothetical protein [Pyrinomonadaceae bacterium]
MPPKFYAAIWTVFLLVIAAVVLTGNLTTWAIVAFGFASFGLIFMGMMLVLPFVATHGENAPHVTKEPAAAKVVADRQTSRAGHGFATPHHV